MKNKDNDKRSLIVILLLTLLFVLFGGAIYFWAGYLDGLILRWLIGDWIIKAFNVFHLEITKDQIPFAFALIGLIAGFFKTTTSALKKND